MTGLNFITSANIQIESIQSCRVGRWIALDNLSQIHFERNRASAIICSVDQKPLFRLFLKGPSEPQGSGTGGQCPPPHFFGRSVNLISTQGKLLPTTTDVWSREFIMWKINFGLWAMVWAGLWNERVWADYEQLFRPVFSLFFESKFFFNCLKTL